MVMTCVNLGLNEEIDSKFNIYVKYSSTKNIYKVSFFLDLGKRGCDCTNFTT